MICSNCGRENQGDTIKCTNCNTPEMISEQIVQVRVSRLAVTAIIFAILGPIIFSLSLIFSFILRCFNIIAFTGICISVIALILGIISFVRIEASGGKITGINFSLLSIIVPIFAGLFLIVYFMFFASRSIAYRMVCGSNLAAIGKVLIIYAGDMKGDFPRAGGKNSTWGSSVKSNAATRKEAYNLDDNGENGSATISASLYLLMEYGASPKLFVCPRDRKVSEFYPESAVDRIFKRKNERRKKRGMEIISYFDFGSQPWKHNSYAYHMPYGQYPVTIARQPTMAMMADRNPWIPSPGWEVKDFSSFNPDGDKSVARNGNAPSHNSEGQNVLYVDLHVSFEPFSFCGLNEDNIYTSWNGSDIRKGIKPEVRNNPDLYHNYTEPASKTDSLLLNDPPIKK